MAAADWAARPKIPPKIDAATFAALAMPLSVFA